MIFIGSLDGNLYAINHNGSLSWKYTADSGIQSSPTIDRNGTIYFSSKYHLYAIGKSTPEPPRNLTVEEGAGYVNLSWDEPAYNGSFSIMRYKIFRGTNQTDFKLISTVARSSRLFKDDIINSNQSFVYYVTAINVKGESLPSNQAFFPIPKLADSPWPMFGNNLKHTGLSSYDTRDNPGKIVWEYDTDFEISASPVIGSDGTIYIGSGDVYFYALNKNGTLKWKFYSGYYISSTAALASDGSIYFCCDIYLYALYSNGTLKWRFGSGDIIHASPTIGPDGTIYFGSYDNYLYAVYPNGSLKWKYQTLGDVNSVPAISDNGTIYFGSMDKYLYSLNPDGSLNWDFDTSNVISSSPVIGPNGTIYISSGYGFYALDQNGNFQWKNDTYGYIDSSPALGPDGTIYIGSDRGHLYALTSSGNLKWYFRSSDSIHSSPSIGSDGTIYFGNKAGFFYAISSSGNLKWSIYMWNRISSSPAIGADGIVYIGSYNSILYAIGHTLPSQPQNLEGDVDLNHINLSWTPPLDDGGSNIIEYRIYKGKTFENMTFYASVDGSLNTFTDQKFQYNNSYSYSVTAVNSIGESESAFTIRVLSPKLPGPPDELTPTNGEGYIDLSWDHNEIIGLPIERFNIYRGLDLMSFEFIDYVSPWVTTYRDPHVTAEQRYYYYVTAVNAFGESKPTDIVSTTPLKKSEKPKPPKQLQAIAGQDFILLSWQASDDAVETEIFEYVIYRGNLFGDQRLFKAVNASQTSFNDTNIYSDDIHYYYIIAVNDWGDSEPSNLVSVKPKLTKQPVTPDDNNSIFNGLMLSIWVILIFIVIVLVYFVLTRVTKVKSESNIKKSQDRISLGQSSSEHFELEPNDAIYPDKRKKTEKAIKSDKATKLKSVSFGSKFRDVKYRKTKNGPKNYT
jgi:outer membrane protein assembly factor BamB